MKKNEQLHSTLLAAVGAYLLYLAYVIFDKMRSGAQEMPQTVAIAASILFLLGGLGAIGYAALIWYRSRKNDDDTQDGPDTTLK